MFHDWDISHFGEPDVAAQEMKTGHFKGKLLFPNYLFL